MSQFKDFHLWEHVQFQAWWLIRSFSMNEQEINKRKQRVEKILDTYSGITLEDYSFDVQSIPEHRFDRIINLLQENSILQDALVYAGNEKTKSWDSIWDILSTTRSLLFVLNQHNMSDIYNFADLELRQISRDVEEAIEKWFFIPTQDDLQDLKSLKQEIERIIRKLNHPGWITIIW